MAMPAWGKSLLCALVIGPAALLGAGKAWHHFRHGHGHDHGHHYGHDHGHHHQHSKCVACLADGQDFCIAEGRCTPRATLTCRGPEDHITGDKDFALHGNPNGIQHSMVCPAHHHNDHDHHHHGHDQHPLCKAAKQWCLHSEGGKIYEGKCKNMWDACGREGAWKKDADWEGCEVAKKKCVKEGAKVLEGHCGAAWAKCGEEVKAHAGEKKDIDTRDCYFDKECHKKVDWEKVGKTKSHFFMRLKILKENGDQSRMKDLMSYAHQEFAKAGVPEDRIDYILTKWVKFILDAKGEWASCAIARKECLKDGVKVLEGHCGVAWEKCGEEVKAHWGEKKEMEKGDKLLNWAKLGHPEAREAKGEWAGCAIARKECLKNGAKVLEGSCGAAWEKCGEEVKAHRGEKMEVAGMAKRDGEEVKAHEEKNRAVNVQETLLV